MRVQHAAQAGDAARRGGTAAAAAEEDAARLRGNATAAAEEDAARRSGTSDVDAEQALARTRETMKTKKNVTREVRVLVARDLFAVIGGTGPGCACKTRRPGMPPGAVGLPQSPVDRNPPVMGLPIFRPRKR